MPVKIGELRDRIVIEEPDGDPTIDAHGDHSQSYRTLASVWARMTWSGSGESELGDQYRGQSVYAADIRYLDGLTTGCRIRWNSMILEITGISDPDGRREQMVLACVTE